MPDHVEPNHIEPDHLEIERVTAATDEVRRLVGELEATSVFMQKRLVA